MSRYIITITPPTPNGDLHLGHLSGPFLAADACRRLFRQSGADTILLSYSDDYQSYLPRKARQLGRDPVELARFNAHQIYLSIQEANIDIDYFLQAANNKTFAHFVSDRFEDIRRLGKLELESTQVFRCDACAVFGYEGMGRGQCNWCGASSDASQCEKCARIPDIAHMHEMQCVLCGGHMHRVPITRYVWKIGHHYGAIADALKKQPKRAALERYLSGVLENDKDEWPVTRPGDAGLVLDSCPGQPVNTWFMGLAGYQAALAEYLNEHPERGSFDDWWSPDTQLVHFLGYDCSYSHAVGYTAQLLAMNKAPLPGAYLTNQFLQLDGKDFSTSRGHAIWIRNIVAQHPVDAVRLYTALCSPENETQNFDRFIFENWRKTTFDEIVAAYMLDLRPEVTHTTCVLPSELNESIIRTRDKWMRAASLEEFSITGVAQTAIEIAQLTMTAIKPSQKHHGWRVFSELVACIAPSLAKEINALLPFSSTHHAPDMSYVEIKNVCV